MNLALAATLFAAVAMPAAAGDLQIVSVGDGVYAFIPTDAAIDAERAISNSAAVVLHDGVLLYDSHLTPALVEEALALLRGVTDKPVRYVVDSHWHGDHTGGDWAYAKDVERITHHATRERLIEFYAKAPQELPQSIAQTEKDAAAATDPKRKQALETTLRLDRELLARIQSGGAPLPTLTFDSKVVLHRGRRVEVYFLGRGHTDGDAVVVLPAEKIVFLGDLVFAGAHPFLRDAYSHEWIATLEKVLSLGAERFVPGHGPVSGPDQAREQIAYLVWLRGAVEPYVWKGSLEQAQKAIAPPERYAKYRWIELLAGNIAKVYGEIKEGR